MTNDDKRQAIIIEIVNRAGSTQATSKYFITLMHDIIPAYSNAKGDSVEMMGLALALMRHAATVLYASVATPYDIQVRTPEEVANLAADAWMETCKSAEANFAAMTAQGMPIPPEIAPKLAAAPSDQSKRPDVEPVDPVAGVPDRPMSVGDLLVRIRNAPTPSTTASPLDDTEPEQAAPPAGPQPTKTAEAPRVAVWCPGSTDDENLKTLGNGKGN